MLNFGDFPNNIYNVEKMVKLETEVSLQIVGPDK